MPYAERAWTNQKVVDRVWQVFVIDRQPANGAYYAPRLNAVGCAIGCLLPPSVAKGLDPVDEWLIGDFIFIGGVLEPGFRGRGAPMLRRWFAECDPALLDALQAWHDKLTAGETATDEDADRLLEYLADHYDIVPTQVAIERAFYRAGCAVPGPLQESERDMYTRWELLTSDRFQDDSGFTVSVEDGGRVLVFSEHDRPVWVVYLPDDRRMFAAKPLPVTESELFRTQVNLYWRIKAEEAQAAITDLTAENAALRQQLDALAQPGRVCSPRPTTGE